ncbi:SNF2 family DNA or RNA helicase [Labedella gwakjiensis]|nr:DEAD/DEAH box helicase [Labedella gwakjiensis]PSL39253.1 SNF2 family DNA or RNA helicase [Labedella gwakjiensis]
MTSSPESWRDALATFRHDAPEPSVGASRRPRTGLALQFELREMIPRTAHRWNGPTSRSVAIPRANGRGAARSASAEDEVPGTGEFRLAARPTAETSKGWARGTMTWTNLPHLLNRMNLDPEQHRWFCELGALHRAAGAMALDPDASLLFLDEFANPVLWAMLGQAADLRIPLIGTGSGSSVAVGSRARLLVDLRRESQGVRLEPSLLFDLPTTGRTADVRLARPIGAHGVSIVDPRDPRDIVIAATAAPLGSDELAILRGRGPLADGLVVPADAVDEFLSTYVPGLRERLEVVSADDSVVLPDVVPPVLVLRVAFATGHRTELTWRWRVSRGGAPFTPVSELIPPGVLPDAWLPDAASEPDGATRVSGAGSEAPPPPLDVTLEGVESAHFVTELLPRLRTLDGVRVETTGTKPSYRELTGDPELVVSTMPSDKRDWFDLGVTVTVDGRTIPFLPLFTALAKGRKRLLLVDGTYLSLKHPAFARLAELIEEAKDLAEWETTPVISRRHVSLWSDFEDLADESRPALEWRALVEDIAGEATRPVSVPSGLTAQLRPYQAEGFSWLAHLWRHGLGGILADDMGLGKTLQCLALVQHAVESVAASARDRPAPFLVVAPTSVAPGWVTEATRFAPGLVVRRAVGTEAAGRARVDELARGADIVVTTYALLRLDADAYRDVDGGWSGVILDEAQFVKNSASQAHEAVRDLGVSFVLAVTGTPLENSLSELHAILALTSPGLFPSARRFAQEFVRVIEQPVGGITSGRGAGDAPAVTAELRSARLERLRRRIAPFLLRRTKDVVAPELPEKSEQVLSVELAPEHRELYDVYLQRERQKLFGLIDDLDRNRFIVFRSLTLLRMLALDAGLVSDDYAHIPSTRLDSLVDHLREIVDEGHRTLVFSQFTTYLDRVRSRLDAEGIASVTLQGSTRDREGVVREFREGDAPVFLISLKAGGFGLTLTEADYVFLLDPWWNPASEEQAIDRTHRIGQDKNVLVYRMVAADTIEEKVMALKERKSELVAGVLDDDGELFGPSLDAGDIRELLS